MEQQKIEKGYTIPVLDKGYVRLIDWMGDDAAILEAARISYHSPSKGDEADKKLGERPVIFLSQECLEEIAGDKQSVLDLEWISRMHAAIECLPIRHALIVRGILAGRTNSSIALELGVSCERVRQLLYTAISKLQWGMQVHQLDWSKEDAS